MINDSGWIELWKRAIRKKDSEEQNDSSKFAYGLKRRRSTLFRLHLEMPGLRAVVPRRKNNRKLNLKCWYHRYKPLSFTFRKMALKFRTYLMMIKLAIYCCNDDRWFTKPQKKKKTFKLSNHGLLARNYPYISLTLNSKYALFQTISSVRETVTSASCHRPRCFQTWTPSASCDKYRIDQCVGYRCWYWSRNYPIH